MAKTIDLLKKNPIAIIGMSSMFADADNIDKFWENILLGVDSIREIPDTRWSIDDYYDPDPNVPDKTYCKVGGFIPDVDFDPMEFGLPPNILEVTDASQLLALMVAKDALIDAGYAPGSEDLTVDIKEKTGVILGVGGGQKLITPLTGRLQYPIWRRALESIGLAEDKIQEAIEKMLTVAGVDDETLTRCLYEGLLAVRVEECFRDFYPDYPTRAKYLDMAFRLKGSYAKLKSKV